MEQDRLDLRSEDQPLALLRIIEGLYTVAITGENQLATMRVPEPEGKHPVEPRQRRLAPLSPSLQDDFRVGPRAEAVP